jgi:hypothetical protein
MPTKEFKANIDRLELAGDDCRVLVLDSHLKMITQVNALCSQRKTQLRTKVPAQHRYSLMVQTLLRLQWSLARSQLMQHT